MSLVIKVTGITVLLAWLLILLTSVPGYIEAGDNKNISACHFCDDGVDFSVRNLICCGCCSRCCGPDRI